MKKILVSGSLAYDHLYGFAGVFQNTLPADVKNAFLSVGFNVNNKAVHYGGCAGNIVYNGKLLGEDFILLGIAGRDFAEYEVWLKKNKIDTQHVIQEKSEYTSQATVVTDQKGQQITFFHEGAASRSKEHIAEIHQTIASYADGLIFAHVAPNNHEFMMAGIHACQEFKIPYFFDPGQAMPVFSGTELEKILRQAYGCFLNEYELSQMEDRLKVSLEDLTKLCPILVITLGNKGSRIYFQNEIITIPAEKPKKNTDPTGCGDAYRAAFLSIIAKKFPRLNSEDIKEAGNLATKLATACLEVEGTQNHQFFL